MRELLITELARFTHTEALTAWAGKILPQKNQLTTSDAEALERAFAAKLSDLGGDAAAENENVEISRQGESANDKLNHQGDLRRDAKRQNGSPALTCETAEQSVTPIGKTLRLRDREHLKIVSTQPCLACGRSPCTISSSPKDAPLGAR